MFVPSWQREMCDRAAAHIPVPEGWYRAEGSMPCAVCGAPYFDHPQHVPHLWLVVLCDGRHVKL